MACDTVRKKNQTIAQRGAEVNAALRRLEGYLAAGKVTIRIGPTGAVVFVGWNDRDGLSDACTYRLLQFQGSWQFRQQLARAEAMSGRHVNERAILAGHHSHDGGKTWGSH